MTPDPTQLAVRDAVGRVSPLATVEQVAEAHVCHYSRTCCCSIQALEPDEECPVHGWPTRFQCYVCGRFMKRPA